MPNLSAKTQLKHLYPKKTVLFLGTKGLSSVQSHSRGRLGGGRMPPGTPLGALRARSTDGRAAVVFTEASRL